MTVIVRHLPPDQLDAEEDQWWMADVIHMTVGLETQRCRRCFKWQTWTPGRSSGSMLTL